MTTQTTNNDWVDDTHILEKVIECVRDLDADRRARILNAATVFFGVAFQPAKPVSKNTRRFSDREVLSPKEFLKEKEARDATDRVVCLAYYLKHYRNVFEFGVEDLYSVGREAFTKLRDSFVRSGIRNGLLERLGKQYRLTILGEQYAQALPNRDVADRLLSKSPSTIDTEQSD